MRTIFEVPYIKVNPRSTIQYQLLEDGNGNVIRSNIDPLQEEKNLRNNTTQGFISSKARKRLADSVDWINELTEWRKMHIDGMTVKYKLTFITLTLPSKQVNDKVWNIAQKMLLRDIENNVPSSKSVINYVDDIIKKDCLNQFLTELRQLHGMKLYIWRAEAQKNGNIHFHIITDVGIHYMTVRSMWNRIIEKFGYVTEFSNDHNKLTLDEYRKKYPNKKKVKGILESSESYNNRTLNSYTIGTNSGWRHPNSTDIHSVKRIRDLRKYVTKYLCKEVDAFVDRLITGRLWFISQALSEARNMTDLITTGLDDEIQSLTDQAPTKVFKTEHCFILQLSMSDMKKLGAILIPQIFEEKLNYLKREIYDKKET
jgi:hypothetical protein